MSSRFTKLLDCRICAESPLLDLFVGRRKSRRNKRGPSVNDREQRQHGESGRKSRSRSLPDTDDRSSLMKKARKYRTRSSSEVKDVVENLWLPHVHSRAWEAFKTDSNLIDFLTTVATSVPRDCDPVLADPKCVPWLGTYIDDEPCVGILKPGHPGRSQTFTNRILAFVFASDESFERLQALPKDPLPMTCNNKECINLAHIAI